MQINDLEDEEIEDVFVLDRDLDGPDSNGDAPRDTDLKALPADLVEQIMTFLRAIRKAGADIPDKRKANELMLTTMHRVLQARLSQYPTTAAQDLEVGARASESHQTRLKMAALVRWGEKVLLQQALGLVAQKMSEMSGPGDAAEPSSKRQKISR